MTSDSDKRFSGSIAKLYQQVLVPLIFEPYAEDLVRRLGDRRPSRVLEIAAGTGVVTRLLAATLPESVPIVATDLNQAMLDEAALAGTQRPVEWRQADAMKLPFPTAPSTRSSASSVQCSFRTRRRRSRRRAGWRFGAGPVDGKIQALVVTARR